MQDRLLNSRELAQILNISRSYAYALMTNGTLPGMHMGRLVRVRERDVVNYVRVRALSQRPKIVKHKVNIEN